MSYDPPSRRFGWRNHITERIGRYADNPLDGVPTEVANAIERERLLRLGNGRRAIEVSRIPRTLLEAELPDDVKNAYRCVLSFFMDHHIQQVHTRPDEVELQKVEEALETIDSYPLPVGYQHILIDLIPVFPTAGIVERAKVLLLEFRRTFL